MVVTQYLKGLFNLLRFLYKICIPDDIIDYMIALRVNFFFIVPDINLLHGFVFFDSEAIVNSLL